MLARVLLNSFKNQYVRLQLVDGRVIQIPRKFAAFTKRGDICTLSDYRGRAKVNLLTDDDESVKMFQMVPYGFQWADKPVNPPDPIATP